ncbi:hypothetical protein GCM10022402_22580 [Salinactinospora qingdaonensis]|uniref:GH26 domain-containing protein n=1 Tax=Salinactinospora qingdaonensis TaxID=702744 RepID=A0ABP7FKU3_9ACTN
MLVATGCEPDGEPSGDASAGPAGSLPAPPSPTVAGVSTPPPPVPSTSLDSTGVPTAEPTPAPGDAAPLSPPAPSSSAATNCHITEILAIDCGVWWGISPWLDRDRRLYEIEEAAGRRMDTVHTWHGIDQPNVPNERERALMARGRFIHANIEARRFTREGHPPVRYRTITAGAFDSSLNSQARAIAASDQPIFITFDHEADADKRYYTRGTPEEFVAAWRHIVDVYRRNDADNAIFVWNVTGYRGNFDRLPRLWPGNDYVDWLSWEAYNMTGCEYHPTWDEVHSFERAMAPMYEWVQTEGPNHGIDPDKPVMIAEMGTVPIPRDPQAARRWYTEIPEVLREYERVRAVQLWDGKTAPTCDFRVLEHPYIRDGYVEAGRAPSIVVPDGVREVIADTLEVAGAAG